VQLGVPVMCFDSDAPRSKRLATTARRRADGQRIMAELAKCMGDKGTVAILAAIQTAPNLQRRVKSVKTEIAKHKEMKMLDDGVF